MQKAFAMRFAFIALSLLLSSVTPAVAQLSINFSQPGVSIGVNFGSYPVMQRVPGYPVYYAPQARSNYFFYDGLYWVYEGDNWYSSSWYNGPWWAVDPFEVPVYVLRVPVRYYRHAPDYFHGWDANRPPRWGDHWGQSWEQRRSGWDQWNRSSAPPPAPLPTYQRQYSGERYPRQVEQQAVIISRNYKYQPKDAVARQHFEQQRSVARSAPQQAQPPQQAQRQQAPKRERPQTQTLPAQREYHAPPPSQARERPAQLQERAEPQARERPAPQPKEHARGKGRDKEDDNDNPGKGKGR
jgi:hypothetical protein